MNKRRLVLLPVRIGGAQVWRLLLFIAVAFLLANSIIAHARVGEGEEELLVFLLVTTSTTAASGKRKSSLILMRLLLFFLPSLISGIVHF
jgi:hypothetical protein